MSKTPAGMKRLVVEVPIPLFDQLGSLAEADDRSLSMYVRRVLRDHIEAQA